jgi:hypothetical protein
MEIFVTACSVNRTRLAEFVGVAPFGRDGSKYISEGFGASIEKIFVSFFALDAEVEVGSQYDKASRTLFVQISLNPLLWWMEPLTAEQVLFERLLPELIGAIRKHKLRDFDIDQFEEHLTPALREWESLARPLGSSFQVGTERTWATDRDLALLPELSEIFEPVLAPLDITAGPPVVAARGAKMATIDFRPSSDFGDPLISVTIQPDVFQGFVIVIGIRVKNKKGAYRMIAIYRGQASESNVMVVCLHRTSADGGAVLRPIGFAPSSVETSLLDAGKALAEFISTDLEMLFPGKKIPHAIAFDPSIVYG